ncbi:MAG TPA: helix-turn-helix transcriptional regulator [Elusimicrobiales bacterium]|nr:helix-turn-helix transcriptional regulator [Elusimicrobiales bacterium]
MTINNKRKLKILSNKIRTLRKKRKITLEKLAYENNISKGNLSDIENCKKSPGLNTLIKIAKGLNCKVKDLLDF